jgi:hypothetical protein
MTCLRGLVTDGALDPRCPNVKQHGQDKHPFGPKELIGRLKLQIDNDPDDGFEQLHIKGNTAFLLKATLRSRS